MLKDFISLTATIVDWNRNRTNLDRVTFRGKDLRTCLRRAIREGADISLPYYRTYALFANSAAARKVRSSLKREFRRRARHTATVNPMGGIEVLNRELT